MKLSKLKHKGMIIYTVIFVLQILVFIYWANCKTNFHIDELYSMGYASNYTGLGNKGNYFTDNYEDFRLGEWLRNADLKEHLIVSGEESVFKLPMIDIVKGLISDKNYIILLNIAGTIAGIDHVSAIPGLVLNIIIFVIAELLLIRFMKKLRMDERIRFLAVAMFGFSGYMISTVEYIRFYMYVIMLSIGILNLFYELWNSETWKKTLLTQFFILVLVYISFRNSEFTIPFFAALMGFFIIAAILRRKRKQLITSLGVCLGGLIYLVITEDFVGILLDPDKYSGVYTAYVSAGKAFHNLGIGTFKIYFDWLRVLFETRYFGTRSVILLLVAALSIAFISFNGKAKTENDHSPNLKRLKPATVIMLLIWLGILGICSFAGHGRFVCLSVLYFIVIWGIKEILGYEFRFGKIAFSSDTIFMAVIACATVALALFEILCEFGIWRYYCFVFTMATIVFWYVLDRLLRFEVFRESKRALIIVLIAFVFINALLPFKTRNIENMYEDEKGFVASIREHEDWDTILFVTVDNYVRSRHESYDCVNMMPDDANIYVVDIAQFEPSSMDYPTKFMVWTHRDRDMSRVLADIKKRGYDVQEFGTDHCSRVYLCAVN